MNLNHLFDLSFAGRRDTVALEWEDRRFTFGELDARFDRVIRSALYLQTNGELRESRKTPRNLAPLDATSDAQQSSLPMHVTRVRHACR